MGCWSQERRNGHYRTCMCCHVRTATICLGVYNLLIDILNIAITLALVIEPDLVPHRRYSVPSHRGFTVDQSATMNNLSTAENASSHAIRKWIPDANDAQFVKLVVNFLTAFFSTCLIYGTIKVRPSFLLPYFCIQLFDFCVSCLAVVGCFTNEANVRVFFLMQEWFPMREQLLALSSGWLMFVAGLLAVIYLFIKAYLINIVWSCYKYLLAMCRILPQTQSDVGRGQPPCQSASQPLSPIQSVTATVNATATSPDAQVLLPPKYEDVATATDHASLFTPPPSYTDVTARSD